MMSSTLIRKAAGAINGSLWQLSMHLRCGGVRQRRRCRMRSSEAMAQDSLDCVVLKPHQVWTAAMAEDGLGDGDGRQRTYGDGQIELIPASLAVCFVFFN